MNRKLLLLVVGCFQFLGTYVISAEPDSGNNSKKSLAASVNQPIALPKGPQLFLDDYLINRSVGIERKVMQPERFLEKPVVTSAPGHDNWQLWFTVLHDTALPAEKRFRIWYNADVNPDPADAAYETKLAYLESADGIHWPGPYKQLDSAEEVLWSSSVLDEGPNYATPNERYKLLYWSLTTRRYGPMVATSPDGLTWTLKNNQKPIFLRQNSFDDSWHASYDPLRKQYFLMGKRHLVHGWTNADGQPLLKGVRTFGISFSQNFEEWSDLKVIFMPDDKDPGTTEFYGVTGFQVRGDLIIGFIQILRDDLQAKGAPDEAIFNNFGNSGTGMGYTVLCWTRDGKTWHRDRQKDALLEPNPEVGTWDHAMAWVSSSVPVGNEVYLYYAGYRWGHKINRSQDRQIGLVKVKRDRYVARQAGEQGGTITTPLLNITAERLTLNTDAKNGELRVQATDKDGKPISGFKFEDCKPIAIDDLEAPVEWQRPLSMLQNQPIHLEFSIKNARLFAFDIQ